jgi:hypothetical protein
MNTDKFTGSRTPAALAAGKELLDVIVEHIDFKRVYDSCIDLVTTMANLKMPAGILIQAESGMGKTLLLQMVKRRFAATDGDESRLPCLHLQLDSAVDPHKMAGMVMLALGYPMLPSRPNLENMNHMIAKGMEKLKPRVLLIDEVQHICEGNRDITARAVTDWLKVRMDAFNVPIIGAGTRTLERLSVINPQFTSRASANFLLLPFEFSDAWRQLLCAFADRISLVDLTILNGQVAKPLHAATKGNFRALKKTLAYACMHAAARADKKVSLGDLAQGFDDVNGHTLGRSNPLRPAT